jgi:zinc protease
MSTKKLPRLSFFITFAFSLFLTSLHANDRTVEKSAQEISELSKQIIPFDSSVVRDTLDNGIVYYIRKNSKPEKRAELRLVINAGSILETDNQQGLAHFVEHMAFNGTRHFKKNELISYLESIGMRFGPDINAYTSFDETVFMLHIPTDSVNIIRTAFEVLHDWAHFVSFNGEEIDKERGVVIEEWRLGRGAESRIMDKQFPVLFKGSRYAERLPIGKVAVLDTFHHEELRRFYNTWYRPDLQAIVAVGDFDISLVEGIIRELFADLPNPQQEMDRQI